MGAISVSSISFFIAPSHCSARVARVLKPLDLDFQFPDPIFRTSQLKRESMRHAHRSIDAPF
jgi:hypothetical protein